MGQAIGWQIMLPDPDGAPAGTPPLAQPVVSELDFTVAGFDERSLVVVPAPGPRHEETGELALAAPDRGDPATSHACARSTYRFGNEVVNRMLK
jgi:hypothetical protein